jgi:hypothetical protein
MKKVTEISVHGSGGENREILPFAEAADQIAGPIVEMLRQYHLPDCPEPIRALFRPVLHWMAHDLENFVSPMVSIAAQERAFQMGLPDLRQFHLNDQKKRMNDPERKIFQWDHYTPVSNIVRELIEIITPTVEAVAEVLKTARVAWILKEEDAKLSHKSRKDPAADYAPGGIRLVL